MNKQAPSLGRILAMVVFALSCFGLLLFLWLAFGGPVPLSAKSYRVTASVPEATTLAQEADVRIAGVTVGKVKSKELEKEAARTKVEIELEPEFGPIPRDSRALLRQKTLLGETYMELTPGNPQSDHIPDGGKIANSNVQQTVELDEIVAAFDEDTRDAFRLWQSSLAPAIRGRGQALNDAFGNLAPFVQDGADVLGTLDEQERALTQVIRNTGVVFRALSEREGQLRSLVENSGDVFDATASRDRELAEVFRIFPTFLDESRLTLGRLETFSRNAKPLMQDLQPVADDLGPTVRDLGGLSPHLRRLFRDLRPLIRAGRTGLPDAERILRGAGPLFDGLHPFLEELNPILAFMNFNQKPFAGFFLGGPATITAQGPQHAPGPQPAGQIPKHYLRGFGLINGRSFDRDGVNRRPDYDRGNAYPDPNGIARAQPLGALESFSCANTGRGQTPNPEEGPSGNSDGRPPCIEKQDSPFSNTLYPKVRRGEDKLVPPPSGVEGTRPPVVPPPG